MGAFKDFVNKKLLAEEAKKVSSNLIKNIIDVVKEYISTEFDVSEDAKMQIINGMQIAVDVHNEGVIKTGPMFVITSKFDESDDKSVPVQITIKIVTDKMSGGAKEQPEETTEEEPTGDGEESTEEVPTNKEEK